MKKYELLYIVESSLTEDQKDKVFAKVQSVIEKEGGILGGVDKWGIKKFAYPINYKNEGYYVLANFNASVSAIAPINKMLLITEGVVRHMITAK